MNFRFEFCSFGKVDEVIRRHRRRRHLLEVGEHRFDSAHVDAPKERRRRLSGVPLLYIQIQEPFERNRQTPRGHLCRKPGKVDPISFRTAANRDEILGNSSAADFTHATLESQAGAGQDPAVKAELDPLRARQKETLARLYSHLSPWDTVRVARHPARPQTRYYIQSFCREFTELHGDRRFGTTRRW